MTLPSHTKSTWTASVLTLCFLLSACGAGVPSSESAEGERSSSPQEEGDETDERFFSEEENQNDMEDGFTSNEDDVDSEFR